VEKTREEKAAKLGFSAYAVTREDDPYAKAIQGLLDHSVEHDKRIDMIINEIEALKRARNEVDPGPVRAGPKVVENNS
jgi:hypothetical protein